MARFILPLLVVTAFALLANLEIPSTVSTDDLISCSCKKKRQKDSSERNVVVYY